MNPKKKRVHKSAPAVNVAVYAYQLSNGVDLMEVDGLNLNTILTIISETGLDLKSKFPSGKHFCSWLGSSPNKKITGGKVLSSHTNQNKNPLAHAFRQAANTVGNQKNTALSQFFHRIAFKKGRAAAITATARKLALIVYKMVTEMKPYKPADLELYQKQVRTQRIKHVQRTIEQLKINQDELVF